MRAAVGCVCWAETVIRSEGAAKLTAVADAAISCRSRDAAFQNPVPVGRQTRAGYIASAGLRTDQPTNVRTCPWIIVVATFVCLTNSGGPNVAAVAQQLRRDGASGVLRFGKINARVPDRLERSLEVWLYAGRTGPGEQLTDAPAFRGADKGRLSMVSISLGDGHYTLIPTQLRYPF